MGAFKFHSRSDGAAGEPSPNGANGHHQLEDGEGDRVDGLLALLDSQEATPESPGQRGLDPEEMAPVAQPESAMGSELESELTGEGGSHLSAADDLAVGAYVAEEEDLMRYEESNGASWSEEDERVDGYKLDQDDSEPFDLSRHPVPDLDDYLDNYLGPDGLPRESQAMPMPEVPPPPGSVPAFVDGVRVPPPGRKPEASAVVTTPANREEVELPSAGALAATVNAARAKDAGRGHKIEACMASAAESMGKAEDVWAEIVDMVAEFDDLKWLKDGSVTPEISAVLTDSIHELLERTNRLSGLVARMVVEYTRVVMISAVGE